MQKLLIYIFVVMFSCNITQAADKDKMRLYLFKNMQNDAIDCYAFYMIMIKDFTDRDPNDPTIKQLESGRDKAYNLYYALLKPLGLTPDQGRVKLNRVLDSKVNISAKKLINNYGKFCMDLMQDQKSRTNYWLNKYSTQQ